MTIQRRINLSFVVIIVFFAVNLGIYYWNNGRARASADSLRRSISRQQIFSDMREEIAVYQKQMEVVSQSITGASAASPEEIQQIQQPLHKPSGEAHDLEDLADADMRSQLTAGAKNFDDLSASWLTS